MSVLPGSATSSAAPDRDAPAVRLVAALWRLLPLFAVVAAIVFLGATLAVAGDTLGYDFRAYWAAGSRALAGQPAYDTSYQAAGGFGLFYYPPTFIPLVLPFALLPETAAVWAWIGLSIAAMALGIAVMPVSVRVRSLVALLAAVSWPVVYAIKLGQVGPVLLLLFAAGWRWLDRPGTAGIAAALGASVKIQPGIVLAWAIIGRRLRDVVLGVVVLGILGLLATLVAGVGAWRDFLTLIGRVADPISTPHNFTVGAVAFQLGASRDAAALLQAASMVLVAAIVVYAGLRLRGAAGYLVAVIASQLLSPILWDHYAVLLLIPVAWLLARGRSWAAIVPLATSVPLVGVIPPVVVPAAFWATLVAVLAEGRAQRGVPANASGAVGA